MTAGNVSGCSGTSTQAYGEAWYWDNRYAQDPSTFDWYQKYPSLAPLIRLYTPPHPHQPILVVGCGNSAFSEGMVEDGYDEVVNIDISSVVIDAMQKKYSNCPKLKCIFVQNAAKMLEEVWRVLKDKGVYILITYGSPVYRRPLLKSLPWTTRFHVIEKLPLDGDLHRTRDLTSAISLDENGSSEETVVGMMADVHYIYVCIKDSVRRIDA